MSLNTLHFFQHHSSNANDANDANAATVTLTIPEGILKTTTRSTECKNMSTDLCLWIIWLFPKCHCIKTITYIFIVWISQTIWVRCNMQYSHVLHPVWMSLIKVSIRAFFWLFNPPQRLASEVYILPLDLSPENWPHSFFPFLPDKNGF